MDKVKMDYWVIRNKGGSFLKIWAHGTIVLSGLDEALCFCDRKVALNIASALGCEHYEVMEKMSAYRIFNEKERPQLKETGLATKDAINPGHYKQGGIECIDAINSMLLDENDAQHGFLRGQVVKYMWRLKGKESPLQDAKKAQWYLERLINDLEGESNV